MKVIVAILATAGWIWLLLAFTALWLRLRWLKHKDAVGCASAHDEQPPNP